MKHKTSKAKDSDLQVPPGARDEEFKKIPSVEKLTEHPELGEGLKVIKPIRVALAQKILNDWRARIAEGGACPFEDAFVSELSDRLRGLFSSRIRRVINATGVLIHTNLGRSPLGQAPVAHLAQELWGYSSLEFDLVSGNRGSRTEFLESALPLLTGAEAGIAVNNCAAATLLVLFEFARGKKVAISRGELVQIGGGFRVPDILEASGAELMEVGTTNMTSAADYESAISKGAEMILKVHQSNFFIQGHTQSVPINELVALGKKHKILVAMDLGSGCLHDQDFDAHELKVTDAVRAQVPLTCFSGDKLFGGPQAGLIVGEKELLKRLKKNPMYRAVRLGKTELSLLEHVVSGYLQGEDPAVWDLLRVSDSTLRSRAESFSKGLSMPNRVISGKGAVGGGTMPGGEIPTCLVEIVPQDPERFITLMRQRDLPVITRIEKKKILIDLRSVFESEQADLSQAVEESWKLCMS